MRKNHARSILSCILVVVCLVTLAIPAAATGSKRMSGNGYESRTILVNGVYYSCNASLGYSNSRGAYSTCYTQALVARQHKALTLVYTTSNVGEKTIIGGEKLLVATSGSSNSYDTGFIPESIPTGYISVSGIIYVNAPQLDGTMNTYTFYLSMS